MIGCELAGTFALLFCLGDPLRLAEFIDYEVSLCACHDPLDLCVLVAGSDHEAIALRMGVVVLRQSDFERRRATVRSALADELDMILRSLAHLPGHLLDFPIHRSVRRFVSRNTLMASIHGYDANARCREVVHTAHTFSSADSQLLATVVGALQTNSAMAGVQPFIAPDTGDTVVELLFARLAASPLAAGGMFAVDLKGPVTTGRVYRISSG